MGSVQSPHQRSAESWWSGQDRESRCPNFRSQWKLPQSVGRRAQGWVGPCPAVADRAFQVLHLRGPARRESGRQHELRLRTPTFRLGRHSQIDRPRQWERLRLSAPSSPGRTAGRAVQVHPCRRTRGSSNHPASRREQSRDRFRGVLPNLRPGPRFENQLRRRGPRDLRLWGGRDRVGRAGDPVLQRPLDSVGGRVAFTSRIAAKNCWYIGASHTPWICVVVRHT